LDRNNDVNNFIDSILFVLELSEKFVEKSLDTIPSVKFSLKVVFSNGEVSFSLGSESFSVGNVSDALFKSGSVLNESLSGVINSLLGDGHELSVGGELVFFLLSGVNDTLDEFGSNSGEFGSESVKHVRIGEISKLKESFDHRTEFGVLKSFTDLLERSLDFGDLDQRGGTGVETVEEFHALINSINGSVGFEDVGLVVSGVLGSLVGGSVHIGEGVNDELFISGDLSLEGGLEWVKDVVERRGGLGDIRFGGGDSVSDGSFPFLMLSKLNVVVLSVDINLELVVSHEILEGLDEVSNW